MYHRVLTGADIHETVVTLLAGSPVTLNTAASIAGVFALDNSIPTAPVPYVAQSITPGDWRRFFTPAAGGGGGIVWKAGTSTPAPTESVEFDQDVWNYAEGGDQSLLTVLKIPAGFIAGSVISMSVNTYSPSASTSSAQTVSNIGPASVVGGMSTVALGSNQMLIPQGGYLPVVGDQFVIAGSADGNNGTYQVTVVTPVSVNSANDFYQVTATPAFSSAESPASAVTAQFSTTIRMLATATLLRKNTDASNSVANQYTSTNAVIALSATANQIWQQTLDLTDGSGKINTITVNPGDLLKLELYRDPADSDTQDTRFYADSTEFMF